MPSEFCPECGMSATCGAEYPFNHPAHYDGVSEWSCDSGHRWGRWSGRLLADGEVEPRFGRGSVAGPPRPKGATADDDREREAGGVSRPLFLPNTPRQAVTPVSSPSEESSA